MIGIGTPINQSSMERIYFRLLLARPGCDNGLCHQLFRPRTQTYSAIAAVPISARCSRRPRSEARSMTPAA